MKYGKNDIINILKRRDGLTSEEATEQVDFFIEDLKGTNTGGLEVDEYLGRMCELEETFQSEFGLEPDYFEALVMSELA